jgi:hypothetical protein
VTPIATADVELPPCTRTALEIVNELRAMKQSRGRSAAGLAAPIFPETLPVLQGHDAPVHA